MFKRLQYGILLGLAILIVDAAIPLVVAHRVADKRAEVTAALTVNEYLQQLLSAYQDAETGQRGFMLTGQEPFLEPYEQGRGALTHLLATTGEAVRDNPEQARRWLRLRELSQQEAEFQEARIAARRRDESIDIAATGRGKQLMDAIRAEIAAMRAAEQQRMARLGEQVRRLEWWSNVSIVGVTAIDVVLFASVCLIALRALRAQSRARERQEQLNAQLADEVRLRSGMVEQVEWQAARLNQIVRMQGRLAASQFDRQALLDRITVDVLDVVPGAGAVVEMIEDDEMVYCAASGSLSDFVGLRLRRSGSLSGLCMAEDRVLISTDTRDDPRVDRAACEKVGARSMVVAPLRREGEPVGVLKVMAAVPDAFAEADVQTLQLMAGYLGATLGHQMQFEKNRLLLTEREITLQALEHELERREQAEATLLSQQTTLRSLTNAIPALVSLVDANERYVYCNEQYEVVFGRRTRDIVGCSVAEFLGETLYRQFKPYIDRALAGECVVYERTLQTGEGQRHQECRHVPQFDADGRTCGFYLIAWDVTERKAQEIEWQSLASTDPLTGLMNRTAFLQTLTHALVRNQRFGGGLAVCYLDVDRFKLINDTYGHAAGDAVLKAFSEYLRWSVRQADIVARLGGDEFCILLDHIRTPENATVLAEKILALARIPVSFDEHTLSVSTSIGIAYTDTCNLDAAQLIALADSALYKAKRAGRDGYVLDMAAE